MKKIIITEEERINILKQHSSFKKILEDKAKNNRLLINEQQETGDPNKPTTDPAAATDPAATTNPGRTANSRYHAVWCRMAYDLA